MITTQPVVSTEKAGLNKRHLGIAALGYLFLTLLMFGDVLFSSREIVLSNQGTDIFGQFLSWRKFGFDQLRQGHIPLWNPYVFSGAPYFGGFQSALLYPLNWLFLFLPLAKAINYSIALHVFLAGFFVYLWSSFRKLHPLACFFAGVVWMFSGPYFAHIYAGHLSNLCTMIWAPLLFLAIDGAIAKPSVGWWLLGTFALAMQILAGHPQYVFYTSFAAGIYFLFSISQSSQKVKTMVCLGAVYAGAVGLSAVQLFAGAQATAEGIRSLGVSRNFASSFSFPQENLLTCIAPGFFGNDITVRYWGRCLFWEMCLFCGVTGFLLAVYGALAGADKNRKIIILMMLLTCVMALGANLKLFDLFYDYVPGFNKFRSTSKFIFLTALFLSLLAAIGLDQIIRPAKPIRSLIYGTLGLALVLMIAAMFIQHSAPLSHGWWRGYTDAMAATNQPVLSPVVYRDAEFVRQIGMYAAQSLWLAAGTAVLIALVLIGARSSRRAVLLLVVIGAGEMFVFARSTRDSFDLGRALVKPEKLFSRSSGDGRFNMSSARNLSMYFEKPDLWGNDPGIPMRYAQFMAFSQRVAAEFTAEFDVFKLHPFFRALRWKYLVSEEAGKWRVVTKEDALPHLLLLKKFRVFDDKKAVLKELDNRAFDPGREVLLENEPNPVPDPNGADGTVKLVSSSTDFLVVEADLPAAAILLVTDSYTPSWRARAFPGSSATQYDLLPADYCLRAVPLSAGHHKIQIEYFSEAFLIGKWISIFSLLGYLAILGWFFKSAGKKTTAHNPIG